MDILSGESGEGHLFQTLELGLTAVCEANSTKGVLRATFLALGNLLVRQGLLDPENEPNPTARGLERLCTMIEEGAGQRFLSREPILMVARSIAEKGASTI